MPSRSSDAFGAELAVAVERVRAAVIDEQTPNPVIVIDGRSGAGKSSLAARLVGAWPLRTPVQLLALDSIYPGWSGLAQGAQIALDEVLIPHSRGLRGTWRRWDWERQQPAEAHSVDAALGLIVEGCGALTPGSARRADVTVWVDGPPASRRSRALERDGDGFRPHWDMWAAQEEAHIATHAPQRLAGITVRTP